MPASLPVPVMCGRVVRPVLFWRVVDEVLAVVPAVGRAGRRAAGDEARAVGRAQVAVRDAVAVRLLAAHAVRPAVVAGGRELRGVLVRGRTLRGRGATRVRPDPRRVRHVGLRVDREPARVAQAHRVDLGLGLPAALFGAAEEVRAVRRGRRRQPVRGADPDRRICAIRQLLDRVQPQHLAVVIVRVARRPARVTDREVGRAAVVVGHLGRRARRALDRRVVARVAVRALRRVRVAGRDVEVALGVEAHAATAVAAGVDLRVVLEDLHLGVQLQLLGREIDREARDAALADLRDPARVAVGEARQDRVVRVERREVLQVDVTRGGEVRRRSDAQQTGLDLAVDLVS